MSQLTTNRFHPKRWTGLTWLAVMLWAWMAIPVNYPPLVLHATRYTSLAEIPYPIGWPINYVRPSYLSNTPAPVTPIGTPPPPPAPSRVSLFAMVANLVLIASAIAALVYLLQTYLRRYSLLTLLAVLSVFPLYWALGRLIFVFGGFRSGEWYIIAVYLSPIPAAIAAKCSFYARIKEWARVRLNWMFRDCPFDDYDNADDAISAASRLDTRGDWDESIDLYRRASQRWPEHSEYIQSSIDRVIEKQSLART